MKYRIFRMKNDELRYLYTRHMWGTSPIGALEFDSEQEAHDWAYQNDIDDYAIENIDKELIT